MHETRLKVEELISNFFASFPHKQSLVLEDGRVVLFKAKKVANACKLAEKPVADTHLVREEVAGAFGR